VAQPYNVRITPEFRKEPDMEKMVRALIAIAEKMATEERGITIANRKKVA